MDDDAGPRSLFALVNYYGPDPPYYSIVQLDRVEDQVEEKVRFNLPHKPEALRLMNWSFSPPNPNSCTEDLYMVPNWERTSELPVKPFHGCKFNIRTGRFLPINLPDSYSLWGSVVNLGPHIYYIPCDILYDRVLVVFQCYDPVKNSWKALEPFPHFPDYNDPYDGAYYEGDIVGSIAATAVWVDTILLIGCFFEVVSIWAYDVSRNKWYPVEVDNSLCKLIQGEAVVIGNTIYALTDTDEVVALSIEKEGIDDHLVFKCSLLWVEYIKPILCRQNERAFSRSRHLVHLGKDKLCVVQSVDCGDDCQPIQLTYIKIKRDSPAIVMDQYFHQVKIQHTGYFMVERCFSLPKGALKEGKCFDLDPYNEDFEGREIVTLHKDRLHAPPQRLKSEDRSIYVRNLPPNATVRQVEKVLTKFGPIKSDGIRVGKDEDICLLLQRKRFACVEFQSRSSKKCAMEESTISIGGCQAEILEKRSTGLTLDDYIIQAVMNMSNDDENDHEPDDGSVLPNVTSKEALQATITLQSYLLQHEQQNIHEVMYALQKVKDGIEFGLTTKKKQVTLDAYFHKI